MDNGKLQGKKMQEYQKAMEYARRREKQQNVEFRTIDRDLNTIRPEIMKLQKRKETLNAWDNWHENDVICTANHSTLVRNEDTLLL